MRTLAKPIWLWILLLSLVWIVGGVFITSDAFNGGRIGGDLSNGIQSIAADSGVEALSDIPLALLFLASGLPVALASLLMLWRGRRSTKAKDAEQRPNHRRQTIVVTVLSWLFSLALWNINGIERALRQAGVPLADQVDELAVSLVIYPVRLFVTFVHEAGHSLAALLSGGQVIGFTVSPDGSGLAQTAGGSSALILPAGYLGAALFGAGLFFLANRIPRWTRAFSGVIGLAIISLTILYARPDEGGSLTALIVGIGYGVGMLLLGWGAPQVVNLFLLNTLAILTGLHALMDLISLASNPTIDRAGIMNDAVRFSREFTPFFSPEVVAALWAVCAVFMLLAAMYFGLVKQVGKEISGAVAP